jgi:hypothetical protein
MHARDRSLAEDLARKEAARWTLVRSKSQKSVKMGTKLRLNGESWTLVGGRPPTHPGSSGRVYVSSAKDEAEYFPHVFNLEWKRSE